MTQDEIIRMAREAGLEIGVEFIAGHKTNIERFAALVASHEREACAKVCEEFLEPIAYAVNGLGEKSAMYTKTQDAKGCAAAIRARGEK